jgi:hypothetical protein
LNPARFNEERGTTISFESLFSCRPPVYAASAFDRLEIDDVTKAAHPLQKGIGPFWLVKLCGSDGPELTVAVSAYSTDLGLRPDRGIDFPAISGGDFFAESIPALRIHDDLLSAEAAVVLVATLSGRRVANVPDLVMPFFRDGSPVDARWHLHLDAPAKLRVSSEVVETRDVYVSRIRANRGSRFWIADAVQPDFAEVVFVPLTFVGEKLDDYLKRELAEMRTLHAVRFPSMPTRFTAATIER